MTHTEVRPKPEISPQLRELLQTPSGQPSRTGLWAIEFAEATHNLDDTATATDLTQSMGQGVATLQTLVGAISYGRLQAREEYAGQNVLHRLANADIGGQYTTEPLRALGIPIEDQQVLRHAANATARFSSNLDRGIYGRPEYLQPGAFDRFALEVGGLVMAVGLAEGQTGRVLWNAVLKDGLDGRRTFSDPSRQQAPSEEGEQSNIQKDARFIAKVAGALQILEQKTAELFYTRPDRVPQAGEGWIRLNKTVGYMKQEFLKSIGLQPAMISLLEDGESQGRFRSQLIQSGYLDQLRKGPPEAASTEAVTLEGSNQPVSPDQALIKEISSVTRALTEKGTIVDTNIEQLKAQLVSEEQQRAAITAAQERLQINAEKLREASSLAQQAADLRSLVGETPKLAQAGADVLKLQPGSAERILSGGVDQSLMTIVSDPGRLSQVVADLYGVPVDKQGELAQAAQEVSSIVTGAAIIPANYRVALTGPLQEALAKVETVVGKENVARRSAEIDGLLNPDASLVVTDADRQQIQQDLQAAKSLLGTPVTNS